MMAMIPEFQLQQILQMSEALITLREAMVMRGEQNSFIAGAALAEIVWNYQLERDPDFSLDELVIVTPDRVGAYVAQQAPAFALAIRFPPNGPLKVLAPMGLQDLFNQQLRPNKVSMTEDQYDVLSLRIQTHWPSVKIEAWNSDESGGDHHHHAGCGCG